MSQVNIQLDTSAIDRVRNELGEFEKKTPIVLKAAINSTARKARTQLVKAARSTYIISSNELKQSMEYRKPTTRNLTAKIVVRGHIRDLMKYKVTPNSPPQKGSKIPRNTKAKVLRKNPMRPLIKNGIKAFVTQFKSGHIAVAQRVTKNRLPIATLYSTSIPKMFSSGGTVMESTLPEIEKMYGDEISKQLEKAIERMRK